MPEMVITCKLHVFRVFGGQAREKLKLLEMFPPYATSVQKKRSWCMLFAYDISNLRHERLLPKFRMRGVLHYDMTAV